jgi:hypothetical protein
MERCVLALVNAKIGVCEVRPSGGSLEEVFASLTASASPPSDMGEPRA